MDEVPLSSPFLSFFIFHKPSLFLSRPQYSMELCTEPLVIWLYIEGKGGERLRKMSAFWCAVEGSLLPRCC